MLKSGFGTTARQAARDLFRAHAQIAARPRARRKKTRRTPYRLPSKVLSLAVEWASAHQQELLDNWHTLQSTGEYHKISPLV